ncbi:hypothetical protein [Methylovirgula sp. HY1]|uniref:hypothetical protein n=1 Tax=Methylovirgula sp. HY1 TaxID=2822761 RepID=UPI001C5B8E48|nr:hypothetical protein [Methylovirgula sp. HY1]QXX75591.1 hypothetical protein MHY1_02415 [Methylovirgula sp. HY1]
MNEIFRVPISKAQLRSIPVDDRNLLLLASHAVNQMSVLKKVLIFSLNYETENELENALSAAQSQMILRFLFGVLAEAWEMVKRPIHQRLIGQDYAEVIELAGKKAHAALKKHFGESNLLHRLRNTIAYHHPDGPQLVAAFEDVPEDEDWAWYPSDTINNSFYLASDLVITAGILRVTGETDTTKAFKKVLEIVVPVSNDLTEFLLYVMRAIISRYLDPTMLSPQIGTGTKIENAPDLYKVAIPFFTNRDH